MVVTDLPLCGPIYFLQENFDVAMHIINSWLLAYTLLLMQKLI